LHVLSADPGNPHTGQHLAGTLGAIAWHFWHQRSPVTWQLAQCGGKTKSMPRQKERYSAYFMLAGGCGLAIFPSSETIIDN